MTGSSDETGSAAVPLPDSPSLEWLRKQAKHRLRELKRRSPDSTLADAQLTLAREHGFKSWRTLKAHIDELEVEGQLFAAAKAGDAQRLGALLDAHPPLIAARSKPYGLTLLHLGARHLGVVDLLLRRGADVNARDTGDNTCAMHWAAAAGEDAVVRRLIAAGGDVVGAGDDHALEVIGWATCWDGCDTDGHRAVVRTLLAHGASHHVFSAIAMDDAAEVRRLVRSNGDALGRRMSHNEDRQLPLHFAVRTGRTAMVALLLELGADPHGTDASGHLAPAYATTPGVDRPLMEAVRTMNGSPLELVAALALGEWDRAQQLWDGAGGRQPRSGLLAMMAKRGDLRAVTWLLSHGADPDERWDHWDARITPLHAATLGGHAEVVRALLAAGADRSIRDTKHDADALEWARFFRAPELVTLLSP